MHYSPLQIALGLIIIVCFALWLIILTEDITKIVERGDRTLTANQLSNLVWLAAIALIALVAYIVLDQI
jgi:hypothetical protein